MPAPKKRPIIVISCRDSAAAMKRPEAAAYIRKVRSEGLKFERNHVGGWRIKEA